jgi:transcriptional regulator with XRE-family HTH domain
LWNGAILVAVGDVESAPPAEVGVNLGSHLRRARQRSGLTLREVARQLGVSASFVSQLENGKSQPSVVTLYSLTQLLGVSIDEMFELEGGPGEGAATIARDDSKRGTGQPTRRRVGAVRPPDQGRPIRRADLGSPADAWPQAESRPHWALTYPGNRPRLVMDWGVVWEQLAPNTGHYLDFMEITYPPGSSSTNDSHMLRHMGFEFGYLLEGELEVTCGFEVFTVRAGGALGMDSSVPHLFRNLGSVPARGIWCVHHEHA